MPRFYDREERPVTCSPLACFGACNFWRRLLGQVVRLVDGDGGRAIDLLFQLAGPAQSGHSLAPVARGGWQLRRLFCCCPRDGAGCLCARRLSDDQFVPPGVLRGCSCLSRAGIKISDIFSEACEAFFSMVCYTFQGKCRIFFLPPDLVRITELAKCLSPDETLDSAPGLGTHIGISSAMFD